MKSRFFLLLCILTVVVGGVWLLGQRLAAPNVVAIRLSSAPFPLTVGPTTLLVSLSDADGTPIDGAAVQVSSEITQGGALTLSSSPNRMSNGQYDVPVIYPRMGRWTVDVFAEIPGVTEVVQERFQVFVYPTSPYSSSRQMSYRSVSEINAAVSANPTQELWIVIPQGTGEMMMEGLGEDLIPAEIYLQVNGRNTLVIRNDDLTDHTIGPFFVQAGETIRQEFTQPAVYQGTCSISHSDEISIIVEA